MIEVNNITKYYGTKLAVDNISFKVEKGEIVGFLGPNGAGKTTTMRIITGYLYPDKGNVKIGGYDVIEEPIEAKKHIGYLPEIAPLYNEMNVFQYLNFVADLKGVEGKKEEKVDHIVEIIEKTGLSEVKEKIIGQLSKGFRQRVGIAEALINNPDVLIFDEPTIGLDPKQIIEIRNLIKELGKEHTVILSSHILQEVSAICEKIIIINNGKLVAIDSQESLLDKLESGMRCKVVTRGEEAIITNSLNNIRGIRSVELIEKDIENRVFTFEIEFNKGEDNRPDISRKLIESNSELLELSRVKLSLEEVFIELTNENIGE